MNDTRMIAAAYRITADAQVTSAPNMREQVASNLPSCRR